MMAKAKSKAIEDLTYEQAYTELEQTVEQLESGDLPLEAALALFERGQALSARCGELLEQAEIKLRELTEDIAGELIETDLKREDK
jgi:exodeoxyribonuclease VII small subunit